MPNQMFLDGPFVGWNPTTEPEFLPEGVVSVADNVSFERGTLTTRPGFRAQFASLLPAPLSQGFSFTRDDGTAHLLFVDGAGRLRCWQEDSSATPILVGTSAQTFDTSLVQFARLDDYVLITGATGAGAGRLFRYRISTGVLDDAASLVQPGTAPQVSLAASLLADFRDGTRWSVDETAPGVLSVPDADFGSSSTSDKDDGQALSPGWTVVGDNVSAKVASNTGKRYLELDNAGSGVVSTNFVAVPVKTNRGGTGDKPRYPLHFRLVFRLEGDVGRTVQATLIGYDGAGHERTRQTQTFTTQAGSDIDNGASVHGGRNVQSLYSFADLGDDTLIAQVKLFLLAGPENNGDDNAGPWITNLSLAALAPTVAQSAGGFGFAPDPAQTSTSDVLCGQQHLVFDLGSTQDLSHVGQIFVPVTFPVPFLTDPTFELRLRSDKTTAPTTALLLDTYTASGQSYLVGDLTVLPTEARIGIRYVEIVIARDVAYATVSNTGQTAFTFAALKEAGNLSLGYAPYEYVIVESRGEKAEQTQSPQSQGSAALSPSPVQAQTQIAALIPTASDASIVLYRRGGTFTDGFFRKVAQLTSGAAYVDNASDADLQDADVLIDHDAAPFTSENPARAVSVHAGRVAVATPTRLYLSQSATGARIGLYWNLSNDFNAPNVPEQGFNVRLPDVGGGKAVRLVPFLTRLVCLMERALYLFGGTDPNDFTLRRIELEAGAGCLGPNAAVVTPSGLWYRAPSGLRVFDGETTQITAQVLDAALVGGTNGGVLCWHDKHLYVGVEPGMLVCDLSQEQAPWSRWLRDNGTFALADLRGIVQGQNGLYLLTAAGQLYRATPGTWGDTSQPNAAPVPVKATVRGRGRTLGPFAEAEAVRLSLVARVAETGRTATLAIVGGLADVAHPYQLASGRTLARITPDPRARGPVLQWHVSAATVAPLTLLHVGLELAERKSR